MQSYVTIDETDLTLAIRFDFVEKFVAFAIISSYSICTQNPNDYTRSLYRGDQNSNSNLSSLQFLQNRFRGILNNYLKFQRIAKVCVCFMFSLKHAK